MRNSVKTVLRRLGLLAPMRDLHDAFAPGMRAERANLAALSRGLAEPLRPTPGELPRTALLVTFEGVRQITAMGPVLLALQLAGYEPVPIASGRRGLFRRAFELFGVRRLLYLEDMPKAADRCQEARRMVESCAGALGMLDLVRDGISCGKFALATLMRQLRTASINLSDPVHRQAAVSTLSLSLEAVDRAHGILDMVRPDLLVFPDRGYTPEGQLYEAALERGIPCFTWNVAHRENALVLKRYGRENRDVHFSTLSEASWDKIRRMDWTEQHWQRIYGELDGAYRTGQWYAEVGTQFNKTFPGREQLMRSLGLDPAKKTAVIFPHMFWDATFFWGTDVFADYKEWFVAALKAACANDRLNWLVKIHPAHKVKSSRDGHDGLSSEEEAIAEHIGTLPAHVRLLPPDVEVSTWSLFQLMDYCLTVRGTVGIEAAMLGIRVLTCGTGRYDRHGFTMDHQDTATYLANLARLDEIEPPSAAEVELARRYAYGIFVARTTTLSSFQLEFARDSTATIVTRPLIRGPAETRSARDLQAIADWIGSGDEDYLALEMPEGVVGSPQPTSGSFIGKDA